LYGSRRQGRLSRLSFALLFAAALALLWQDGALALTRKIALVIGNGAYQNLQELPNPPNDAQDMAQALKSLGFEVKLALNLKKDEMIRAIDEFGQESEKASVSLFYYGGHGLQLSEQNYLVPVDAELHKISDIDARTVRFNEVLQAQSKAPGIHLIFLDACRENPAKGAVQQQGLARIGNAPGFLIAFSTTPNNVAFDGGGRNSPFAQALLAHLSTPGADISSVMIATRNDVRAATGDAQNPYDEDTLTSQFYFAGQAKPETSQETTLWQVAAREKDASLMQAYLEIYPDGSHSSEAKSMITDVATAATGNGSAPGEEETLWNLARSLRRQQLVQDYLQTFPDGPHAAQARDLVASLRSRDEADASPDVVCERLATHPNDSTVSLRGSDLPSLTKNANTAIAACEKAAANHPQTGHYVALLARAKYAGGHYGDAVALYKQAAGLGDTRAMVSLGLLLESGDHVAKDAAGANAWFEKAAEHGSADGAMDLAVELFSGVGATKDPKRAFSLMQQASASGSARATYDLGVLVSQGQGNDARDALTLFRQAASDGYSEGYRAAAVLLDEGRGVRADPDGAAEALLQAIAEDSGQTLKDLTATQQKWSLETVKAVQVRLKQAGYYNGDLNGRTGPMLADPLRHWRQLGDPKRVASDSASAVKN
jgi:TPR repeat protein